MEVLAVGVGLWDWPPMSLVALKPGERFGCYGGDGPGVTWEGCR